MSAWFETEQDDIEINKDKKEVGIYITDDEWGSIYKILTFDQINKIAEEINE